jgi:murein DD-endopeptidase MepM/ murein hydrolase activator NlpD
MRKGRQRGGFVIPALVVFFCVGIYVGWWLKSGAPMPAASSVASPAAEVTPPHAIRPLAGKSKPSEPGEVAATTGEPLIVAAPPTSLPAAGAIADLRRHDLRLPLDDVKIELMDHQFDERRDGGGRPHEAVDMLAPRNTPIRAVEDGMVAKLFESKAGGLTIYQYDPSGRFCYYYAHLERYAPGLHDGQRVSRGEVIGYVGTSGNAPANTPHLHFAVFELEADHRWWKGRAIDPYLIFKP